MEFYLIEDGDLKLRARRGGESATESGRRERKSERLGILLSPVVPSMATRDAQESDYCDYLHSSLVENVNELKHNLRSTPISPCLQMRFVAPSQSAWDREKTIVRISGVDYLKKDDGKGTSIFTRLKRLYGSDNVKVNLKIIDFHSSEAAVPGFDFEEKDLEIKPLGLKDKDDECGCVLQNLDFPINLRDAWFQAKEFTGHVTLTVTFSDDAVNKLFLHKYFPWQLSEDCKMTLEQGVCSDLVIVAANGVHVKCHKVYLAVRSAVFKAMFESEMRETATNSVDMSDMSEAGVRAFLAFIYHWDLKEASRRCDIALELFQAGHKYDISNLEYTMDQLMRAKPNKWFSVDMAVKLFLFTKKVNENRGDDEFGNLLKKSVQILKWYSKTAHEKLRDSVEYQQLFEKNPKAAMDLTSFFLTTT